MNKFGERLRFLRTSAQLSQMDLAKQLKLSKSSVNMYERGEREPGLVTLEAIADLFNVDLDYLLGKSDQQNRNAWIQKLPGKNTPHSLNVNTIRIAGRDGSYLERVLTDDQIAELMSVLDRMPDASGGL